MSLQTWKDEFMPVPVENVPENEVAILQRDLKKWLGLRDEELKRHGVLKSGMAITDGENKLSITSSSCALCHYYLCLNTTENRCFECPIKKVRNVPCDKLQENENPKSDSPYQAFVNRGNPEPMIELLQTALDKALEKLPKCERCKHEVFEPVQISNKQFCLTCTCPDCGGELEEHLDLCLRCMNEFLENDC